MKIYIFSLQWEKSILVARTHQNGEILWKANIFLLCELTSPAPLLLAIVTFSSGAFY